MNMFPAQPGTVMRQYDADGDHTETPVVGWVHIQGSIVFPVFCVPGLSAGPGSAIWIPSSVETSSGYWCYPHKGVVTSDETKLEGMISEALGEEEEKAPAPKNAPVTVEGKPDTRPLSFGAKTYNTKSFWHWETANAIFEIEGKEVYPSDPRVVKIKRDEYAKLKRDGAVKIDPHSGLINEDSAAPEDDEEDDVAGLI